MAKVVATGGAGRKMLEAAIRDLKSKQARVGFFPHSQYADGTPVAYVAAIQEFGHGAIPPRPFFRPTIAEQREAWKLSLAKGSRAVLAGRLTVGQMLQQFGAAAAGDVAAKIASIQTPPLSMATLLLRKRAKQGDKIGGKAVGQAVRDVAGGTPDISGVSTKPLVDSGYLISQVTNDVVNK